MNKNILKGTMFFTIVLIIYLIINNFSKLRDTYLVMIGLDDKIPLIPLFVLFYFSLYILIFLPFILNKDVKDVLKVYTVILLISFIVFIVFPTEIIRPILGNSFFENILRIFWDFLPPHSAFPSMHVSLGLAAVYFLKDKLNKIVLFSWFFFVLLSTLFLKQHYILDIVSGLLLASVVLLIKRNKKLWSKIFFILKF